jgi:hypothetical protein
MPFKSLPQIGDSNWGTPLNAHINQLIDPVYGGVNRFDKFVDRPNGLTADDAGKTLLYTKTGNLHQWIGTAWKVLNDAVINVMDYGAIGDGVADDTSAINACIALATTNAKNTTVVFLPYGNFKVTQTITIPDSKSTTLEGASKYGSILLCDHDVDGVILGNNSNLKNFTIYRADRGTGYTGNGLKFTNQTIGAYQEVNNVYARGYWDWGMLINCTSAKFYNSQVIGANNGIWVSGGNCTLYSCYAEVCINKGLYVNGQNNHFYDFYTENCNKNNNTNYAVHIQGSSTTMTCLTYDPTNSGNQPNIVVEASQCTLIGLKPGANLVPNKIDVLMTQYATDTIITGIAKCSGGSNGYLPTRVSDGMIITGKNNVPGGILTNKFDGFHKIVGTVIISGKGKTFKGWQSMVDVTGTNLATNLNYPRLFPESTTSFSNIYPGSSLQLWAIKVDLSAKAKVKFGIQALSDYVDNVLVLDGTVNSKSVAYNDPSRPNNYPIYYVNPDNLSNYLGLILTHEADSPETDVCVTYEIIYTFS